MRRIFIDDRIKIAANKYVRDLTAKGPNPMHWHKDNMPRQQLKTFAEYLRHSKEYKYAKYVRGIVHHYRNLLKATPDEFSDYCDKFNAVKNIDLNRKFDYRGSTKEFYKHIIDCMRYKDLRSNLLRKFVKDLNIKACVYCNAQYAITTDSFADANGKEKIIGTYQFDHFLPESKYPFLCTSIFNLQPSCATCNGSKLDRDARFVLYTTNEEDNQDEFRFELLPINAYVKDDLENLHVELKSDNKDLLDNHRNLFHIDQIYSQHTDVLQRVVVIMKSNNRAYRASLKESLTNLFPDGVQDPEYFFFGYYMQPEHIHLQPLSKMVQDVVKQLKE
jgi:5-methylcytosine-specific restriction endonuclease McrA